MEKRLELRSLEGKEALPWGRDLASLRMGVFAEYPYLYQGSLEYEETYLQTYFRAAHSLVCLLLDEGRPVGASTGILASEEEESFRAPFERHGLDPAEIFYCGESVLLPRFRGQGWGKRFFREREAYARALADVKWMSFCSVERGEHPLRPREYRPLDEFWRAQGFSPEAGLVTTYEWKDVGDVAPSTKSMQFWLKRL